MPSGSPVNITASSLDKTATVLVRKEFKRTKSQGKIFSTYVDGMFVLQLHSCFVELSERMTRFAGHHLCIFKDILSIFSIFIKAAFFDFCNQHTIK